MMLLYCFYCFCAFLLSFLGFVQSQSSSVNQSAWPQVVPVAVRSPYLNCWLFTQTAGTPYAQWAQFWDYVSGNNVCGPAFVRSGTNEGFLLANTRLGRRSED